VARCYDEEGIATVCFGNKFAEQEAGNDQQANFQSQTES